MKLGLLTSSRADFGIYLPLIRLLKNQSKVDLEIIAFGAHTSKTYGYTIEQVRKQFDGTIHELEVFGTSDTSKGIASNFSQTIDGFASFWPDHKYDLVFCLGDRYEMLGAVTAGVFFNQKFAHIHGGEETTGAYDNIFRHSISHFSQLHFTSLESYADRVSQLLGDNNQIHVVGALALDEIDKIQLFSLDEMKQQFGIDFSIPSILITFHPETMLPDAGLEQLDELITTLESIEGYQLVITQTNADTNGLKFRKAYEDLAAENANVKLIESFGLRGYFSAMQYAQFMLGNTSSGILEAASFNKVVLNLGNRQKGRVAGENVLHLPVEKEKVLNQIKNIQPLIQKSYANPYWKGGAAERIWSVVSNNEYASR